MFSLDGYTTNVRRQYFGLRKSGAARKDSNSQYVGGYEFQFSDVFEGSIVNCYSKNPGKLVAENIIGDLGAGNTKIYLEDCVEGLYAVVIINKRIVFESLVRIETEWIQLIGYLERAVATEALKLISYGGVIQRDDDTRKYYFDSKHNNDHEENSFSLDGSVTIEDSSESILENLPLIKEPHSLSRTFNKKSKSKSKSKNKKGNNTYLFAAVIGLALLGYYSYPEEKVVVEAPVKVDPFLGLVSVLERTGVNVKMRMVQLYGDLKNVTTAPNYKLTKILVDPDKTRFDFQSNSDSRLEYMNKWADAAGYLMMTFDANISIGNFVSKWPVLDEAVMIPVQGVLNYIVDCSYNMLRNTTVDKGKVESKGEWSQRKITVKFTKWSPEDFDTLGSLLQGQPVSFETATISHSARFFSGEISMIIYGEG
jgi:hypothetical protein